jgi:hypothetical protein
MPRKMLVALLAGAAVSACSAELDEGEEALRRGSGQAFVDALTGRACTPDSSFVPLPILIDPLGGPPDDPSQIAALESVLVDCDGVGADASCAFPRPGCDQMGCCRDELVQTYEVGEEASWCGHGECARLEELRPYRY